VTPLESTPAEWVLAEKGKENGGCVKENGGVKVNGGWTRRTEAMVS